ncbi:MAG: hypothetical protein PHV18_16430 [Lachnospiraceae bacterium]|nr:hypothetical protein [Lachnospiraceae bacterium]
MKTGKRLSARGRACYMAGMKRYQEQGVRILIDGKEADELSWEAFFDVREDGGFYMGDYIFEETAEPTAFVKENETVLARETPVKYGTKRKLKEIRFDLVYNR